MGQTDKGVLIFAEWFEAMESVSPKSYKALMQAVYRYQIHNEEPVEFNGKAKIVADLIFPFIRRRKAMADAGRKGMKSRYSAYGINPTIDALLDRKAENDAKYQADN
ncbi:MAG: hypothetical protein E7649_03245 [Ruminococcaceae bacterium]|nr:hypothetical protein [Oscillospiraceae bacterium]